MEKFNGLVLCYIGKIFGNLGYIRESLKDKLKKQGIELITYHRKNMRLVELSSKDETMLKQRNKIETIFSLLKQSYHLVSSRHRSFSGYFVSIYASLYADQICYQNKLPIYNNLKLGLSMIRVNYLLCFFASFTFGL